MQTRVVWLSVSAVLILTTDLGCKRRDARGGVIESAAAETDELTIPTLRPTDCEKPGRALPIGVLPKPADLAKDAYCADVIMRQHAPLGAVAVFGSARLGPDTEAYKQMREFARAWSETPEGRKYPILTGGGPGLMEAANLGASEAAPADEGGRPESLGFTCFFGSASPEQQLNQYVSTGFIFTSFAQREAEMVDRAVAVIVGAGGIGTEWEIFEVLSKIQTGKKPRVPVVFLKGKNDDEWTSFRGRLAQLKQLKTIKPEDEQLVTIVDDPMKAVELFRQKVAPVPTEQ